MKALTLSISLFLPISVLAGQTEMACQKTINKVLTELGRPALDSANDYKFLASDGSVMNFGAAAEWIANRKTREMSLNGDADAICRSYSEIDDRRTDAITKARNHPTYVAIDRELRRKELLLDRSKTNLEWCRSPEADCDQKLVDGLNATIDDSEAEMARLKDDSDRIRKSLLPKDFESLNTAFRDTYQKCMKAQDQQKADTGGITACMAKDPSCDSPYSIEARVSAIRRQRVVLHTKIENLERKIKISKDIRMASYDKQNELNIFRSQYGRLSENLAALSQPSNRVLFMHEKEISIDAPSIGNRIAIDPTNCKVVEFPAETCRSLRTTNKVTYTFGACPVFDKYSVRNTEFIPSRFSIRAPQKSVPAAAER